jgi:hypothetical protein
VPSPRGSCCDSTPRAPSGLRKAKLHAGDPREAPWKGTGAHRRETHAGRAQCLLPFPGSAWSFIICMYEFPLLMMTGRSDSDRRLLALQLSDRRPSTGQPRSSREHRSRGSSGTSLGVLRSSYERSFRFCGTTRGSENANRRRCASLSRQMIRPRGRTVESIHLNSWRKAFPWSILSPPIFHEMINFPVGGAGADFRLLCQIGVWKVR